MQGGGKYKLIEVHWWLTQAEWCLVFVCGNLPSYIWCCWIYYVFIYLCWISEFQKMLFVHSIITVNHPLDWCIVDPGTHSSYMYIYYIIIQILCNKREQLFLMFSDRSNYCDGCNRDLNWCSLEVEIWPHFHTLGVGLENKRHKVSHFFNSKGVFSIHLQLQLRRGGKCVFIVIKELK